MESETYGASSANENRQLILRRRPTGLIENSDFEVETSPIPHIEDGEFLVRNEFISIDPAMRRWMAEEPTYMEPINIGDTMRALAGGTVVESLNHTFTVGSRVTGGFGVQDYAVVKDGALVRSAVTNVPFNAMLGPVGLTGLTAYFGVLSVGSPKAGQTALISAAAGAVGSIALQIAKLQGCRVIGIAGSAEKCKFVTSLGADACLNYRDGTFAEAFRKVVPEGIDFYFDNVGGQCLDLALANLNIGARIALCGGISQYNEEKPVGPRNYLSLVSKRARMEGFLYSDFAGEFDEAERQLAAWVERGQITYRIDELNGFEKIPEAINRLFTGGNVGKLVVRIN